MFDPDYTGEEGLVFRMPCVGIWVNHSVTIGFGVCYLVHCTFARYVDGDERSNQTMEPTANCRTIQLFMTLSLPSAATRAIARGG